MRKPDPLRIFAARRVGIRNRLLGEGVSDEMAERWLTAWEAEARSRLLDARTGAFWEPAYEWIAEQRPVRQTPPSG
jgi:hypothetical protein